MADVEDADGIPDGCMLGKHAGTCVLQGHRPAAERRELRAGRDMSLI
jgi:hypothetical protein